MDSRIISVAEKMMKRIYKLGEDYVTKTCNVKTTTVEMVTSNGLIELKVKFPRSIIEDAILAEEDEVEDDGDEYEDEDEE